MKAEPHCGSAFFSAGHSISNILCVEFNFCADSLNVAQNDYFCKKMGCYGGNIGWWFYLALFL